MHPFLQAQLAVLHQNDLRADAARSRSKKGAEVARDSSQSESEVVIRRTTSVDGPALAALSALDSAPMPLGPALVAEVAGSPLAVLPLDGGRAFGDPFRQTTELVALLELRATQMRREADAGDAHRRGPLGWVTAPVRRLV